MRVYLVNDTTSFHAGSAAATHVLRSKIEAAGHTIVKTAYRPEGPDLDFEDFDCMVVNGEGFMRNETKWDVKRIASVYSGLVNAQEMGKQTHLVNSVWWRMGPRWRPVLQNMTSISVREPLSMQEMERDSGRKPDVHLDLSYYAPVPPMQSFAKYLIDAGIVGDFYPGNTPDKVAFHDKIFEGMFYLGLGGGAGAAMPYYTQSWEYVVDRLREAKLYATGQHHGVYAACRARCPFAVMRVNTHKLEGLFKWARAIIPIAETRQQMIEAMEYAKIFTGAFEQLFDFMEQQQPWECTF